MKENISQEQLRTNLLELTNLVANEYEQYSNGFPGVELTQAIEKKELIYICHSLKFMN